MVSLLWEKHWKFSSQLTTWQGSVCGMGSLQCLLHLINVPPLNQSCCWLTKLCIYFFQVILRAGRTNLSQETRIITWEQTASRSWLTTFKGASGWRRAVPVGGTEIEAITSFHTVAWGCVMTWNANIHILSAVNGVAGKLAMTQCLNCNVSPVSVNQQRCLGINSYYLQY